MVTIKYVYRELDGRFIGGGPYDVPPPPNHGMAAFGDADVPDLKLHRFDTATGGKRLATAQEIAAADDEDVREQAGHTSRQKDIAATIAFAIRSKDTAAWNAMSPIQKKNAVLAGCDAWRDLRALVEKLW